jgi:ABC-type multidrug transport system fused ATPase/permease subunit
VSLFDPRQPLSAIEAAPPVSHIYRRIGRFMLEFKPGLTLGVLLSFVTSVAFALLPWPIRYVIDGVLLNDHLDLWVLGRYATETTADKFRVSLGLGAAFLAIQLVAALAASASFYTFARTALYMIHTLRGRMVRHLRQLSLGYHAERSTGDMIFRSINDARAIQEVMIFGVQAWIIPLFQITFMVILMLVLDPVLTLAAVAVGPVLVITIRKLTLRIQQASQESRSHMSRLTSLIEQTMSSIRAVQVFGKEGNEADRFDSTSRNFIRTQLRFRMTEQALSVSTMLITGLGTALVLVVASNRVIQGAVSVGSLWIFVNYMQRIYDLLQQNMNLYGMLQDSVVGVSRAFQVLDTKPDIVDGPDAVTLPALATGIELSHVSLAYRPDQPVLRDVSFTVERGQKIAIVGPTGAGKTSLINLIPRLYDVTEGAVRFDGIDVRQATLASLRDQVSLVPQEPLLFAGSIRDNILYGRRDASDDEVESASRAARAHQFITALHDGYLSDVGERGAKLSVGQQQRIAIARAFLKDAAVLLLDEPTSALDLATESDLLESLDELMRHRTVFIIAHRLSTIRHADRILVLDDGRIVEDGPHDQLLAAGGLYHRLYTASFGRPDNRESFGRPDNRESFGRPDNRESFGRPDNRESLGRSSSGP